MSELKPQWYLITSNRIPNSNWILRGNPDRNGFDLQETFCEDFGQVLTPLGEDLNAVSIRKVPENTVFAGFIWGDGTYFNRVDRREDYYGILGEFRRTSADTFEIHGPNGQVLIDESGFGEDETLPRVLPPEAFGLRRAAWWEETYPWCKS